MEIDFAKQIERLKDTGYRCPIEKIVFSVPDAKKHLSDGIRYFCGNRFKWVPQYGEIAEWMSDNKGRGLILMGPCGMGKTLIGMYVLPLIINFYCKMIVTTCTANELMMNPDKYKRNAIVYVDDVGTESVSVSYGSRRIPFAELVDDAERGNKIIIITTNLSVDALTEKYGERVVDRLRAITKIVLLQGESMRK